MARIEIPKQDMQKAMGISMARIEIPKQDMQKAMGFREEIVKLLKDAGFKYITLDLEGFRSGSMNEDL
jgi:uncharacterized protein